MTNSNKDFKRVDIYKTKKISEPSSVDSFQEPNQQEKDPEIPSFIKDKTSDKKSISDLFKVSKKEKERKKEPKEKPPTTSLTRLKQFSTLTVGAIIIAVGAVGYGLYWQFAAFDSIAATQANKVRVLVAEDVIEAGSVVTPDKIGYKEIPKEYVTDGYLDDMSLVVGNQVLATVPKNAQLRSSNIVSPYNDSSLASSIRQGYKGVTIDVTNASGLAGLLHVNDEVNVVSPIPGSFDEVETVAEKVRISALDNTLSGTRDAYKTVTLEVTEEQASSICAHEGNGRELYLLIYSTTNTDSFKYILENSSNK